MPSSSTCRAAISSTRSRYPRHCARTSIAGAAMDVGRALDQMPSPELAKLPNVIATPHIGGLTPPAIESQSLETVGQGEKSIAGEVPAGGVNPDQWARRPLPPKGGVQRGR